MRRRPSWPWPAPRAPINPDLPGGRPARFALVRIVTDISHFDSASVNLVAGSRVAAGVLAALVIGLMFHSADAAASMGAGALLVGLTTTVGGRRPSLQLLAAVTVAMGVSTFVGSTTGDLGWVHTALLVPWCLVGGLLMALGSPTSSVGTQAIAAMIVFGRFAEPLPGAGALAGYVIAGGAIQIAVVALTRWPTSLDAQRRAMATGCLRLAALAQPRSTPRSGLPTAEALDEAEASLSSLDRGGMEDIAALRSLVDVARRARLELLVIDGLEDQLARISPAHRVEAAADHLLASLADLLTSVGNGLSASAANAKHAAAEVAKLLDQAAQELALLATEDGAPTNNDPAAPLLVPAALTVVDGRDESARVVEASLRQHLSSFAGQVRAIADLAARAYELERRTRRGHLWQGDGPSRRVRARNGLEALTAHLNLDSSIARHALRLTIVVVAAEILASRTSLQRGYWVALTVSVVLRPDFSATIGRGLARVLGTCLGVGLAGLFDLAIHPSTAAMVVTATVFCIAACATFQASYVAYSGFLTGLVVVLVGLVTPGTLNIALSRLADTAIGGALALGAYALWPSWSRSDAWRALGQLAAAQRVYLSSVLAVLIGGRDPDEGEGSARAASAAARRARSNAETTVARSLSEPAQRRIDAKTSEGVLGALRRINLATHALRTDVASGRPAAPVPELAPFGTAVEDSITLLHGALERRTATTTRTGTLLDALRIEGASSPNDPVAAMPPLRRLHDELSRKLEGRSDTANLLGETDELVDAIDTAADLLEIASPQ